MCYQLDTNDIILSFLLDTTNSTDKGSRVPIKAFYLFWQKVTNEFTDTYADVSYKNLFRLSSYSDSYFDIDNNHFVTTEYFKHFNRDFLQDYIYSDMPEKLEKAISSAALAVKHELYSSIG